MWSDIREGLLEWFYLSPDGMREFRLPTLRRRGVEVNRFPSMQAPRSVVREGRALLAYWGSWEVGLYSA